MRNLILGTLLSAAILPATAQKETGIDTTFTATSNPFVKYKYLGDPAALVDGNTVYIYAGHDECPDNQNRYVMNEWCILSTTDMKTFKEHSYRLRATDFPWASGQAWASQTIKRGNKYYWYVTAEHKDIHGKAVGVAVSDSPTGPFIPTEKALVTNDMTTRWTGISWDDIDPTVMVDDDGQAYMFWGNTQLYYAKLKDNMIELDGDVMPVSIPGIHQPSLPAEQQPSLMAHNIQQQNHKDYDFYTEAPWIHKHKGWYYLTFSVGFPEKTAYAMSKSINGPWEYKGILNEIAGNSNTNHHAIIEFKGNWYFVYHNGGINTAGASYRRSLCIDRLYYKKNGELQRVQMTSEGLWGK
ncbi:MAG: glycoside hydrolase family 43 protein [Bacteroides sp.]|nr:glycoside hydrolase family 43 protein [Roseburia sp.]MCM1346343.1 glycoside hydrolase family 43 protein [Bacteroides sp.]MCM1420278.1 glycoside hydrolase family 43 protein [Bacteroides sp.]